MGAELDAEGRAPIWHPTRHDQRQTAIVAEGYCLGAADLLVCVDEDGQAWPWVVTHDIPGTPQGCACKACVPHEQARKLTRAQRDAMGLIHRCGAPASSTGRPCRIEVDEAGQRCQYHQHQAAES